VTASASHAIVAAGRSVRGAALAASFFFLLAPGRASGGWPEIPAELTMGFLAAHYTHLPAAPRAERGGAARAGEVGRRPVLR
jgi:hypothetical protein